jgi:quinol monooxygenase YgiN
MVMSNVTVGLWVPLEAKPGKEDEVAEFLVGAKPLVDAEPDTVAWFAVRMGPTSFGIFDVFEQEEGRQAHLSGKVAAALMQQAPELFATPPDIGQSEVLASKLP